MESGGKLSELFVRCNSESPSLLYGYPRKILHTGQKSNIPNYFLMLRKLTLIRPLKCNFCDALKTSN